MTVTVGTATHEEEKVWRHTFSSGLIRFVREKPLGAAGGLLFLLMMFTAVLAPVISPHDPLTTNVRARLTGPSLQYWFGTDHLGRDVLSRVIYGTQISILVGVTSSVFGTMVGGILGMLSGYVGGKLDLILQRVLDVLLAFPALILALALMAVMGTSIENVITAIAIPFVPRANRVIRSVALSVKEFQFIEASRAIGAKPARIVFLHVLPNTMAPYLIIATSLLGSAILMEASLSFLGLGIPPPHPSWGRALSEAMTYYLNAPWMAIFPGLAISLSVFGANLLGDALRDAWDPKLKRL